jgi:hypothetical protein
MENKSFKAKLLNTLIEFRILFMVFILGFSSINLIACELPDLNQKPQDAPVTKNMLALELTHIESTLGNNNEIN